MNDEMMTTGFWDGEACEYCDGPILEKQVTVHRQVKRNYYLFENVPAGVCKECGTRYYAANVLKRMEGSLHGQQEASRAVIVPVFTA